MFFDPFGTTDVTDMLSKLQEGWWITEHVSDDGPMSIQFEMLCDGLDA